MYVVLMWDAELILPSTNLVYVNNQARITRHSIVTFTIHDQQRFGSIAEEDFVSLGSLLL